MGVGEGKIDDQGMLKVVPVVGQFVIIVKNYNVVVGHPLAEVAGAVIFFGDCDIPVGRV